MRYILSLIILITMTVSAQNEKSLTQTNKFSFGGDIGLTFTASDYENLGMGFIVRGVGNYIMFNSNDHAIGLRGYGGYGISSGSDDRYTPNEFSTDLYMLAAGGIYSYAASKNISPFIFLGVKFLRIDPKDPDGNSLPNNAANVYDKNIFNLALEFGLKFTLNKNLYGYASINPISLTNDYIDDRGSGDAKDLVIALHMGVMYSFDAPWSKETKYEKERKLPSGVEERRAKEEKVIEEEFTEEVEEELVEEEKEELPELDEKASEAEKKMANIVTELSSKLETGVVNFDYGSTELNRMEYVELDRLYKIISEDEKSKWKIVGYTDNIEPREVHQSLAIQRAYFVLRYFMSKGIERERFDIVVKGEENPVADNSTSEGRAKNRRVEVVKKK